mmetsp:Transcript_15928/g.34409  ORF Transcript_15928/g.34409 Transcript_15928/m.34409 type:complete len:209 (+) Transcript_15928:674-1300(+)
MVTSTPPCWAQACWTSSLMPASSTCLSPTLTTWVPPWTCSCSHTLHHQARPSSWRCVSALPLTRRGVTCVSRRLMASSACVRAPCALMLTRRPLRILASTGSSTPTTCGCTCPSSSPPWQPMTAACPSPSSKTKRRSTPGTARAPRSSSWRLPWGRPLRRLTTQAPWWCPAPASPRSRRAATSLCCAPMCTRLRRTPQWRPQWTRCPL